MMNRLHLTALGIALFALCLASAPARADSPLTSTPFHQVFTEDKLVMKAAKEGVMSFEFGDYLTSPKVGIARKAALINALGWDIEGKHNGEMFLYYLALKHREQLDTLELEELTPHELFCIGYLTVLDNYFEPEDGLALLQYARELMPESLTVALITALAESQVAMADSFDAAWLPIQAVLDNEDLEQDFPDPAFTIIMDYMSLYAPDAQG
jgi:hypothetical protein